VCDPATSTSAEPDLGGPGGVARRGIWRAAAVATAGTAWIRGNRDRITWEEEDLLRKSAEKGRNRMGSGVLASGLTGRERENRVSEEAISATHLARRLEG
jgi:hypothetical protein